MVCNQRLPGHTSMYDYWFFNAVILLYLLPTVDSNRFPLPSGK